MPILEALLENWKVALVIVVLLVVNALTFSAQELALQRERALTADLAKRADESANREAKLLAANATQATRIAQLESTLRTGGRLPATTSTPERAASASAPVATVVVAPATPAPPTSAPPTATHTSPPPTPTTPAPTPTKAPTTAPTARPQATAVATPSPQPAATAAGTAPATRYISTPNRAGVMVRLECRADSPTAGVWPDGTRVTVQESSPACPGWLKVSAGTGTAGWVADFLLSAAPPG